MNQHNMNVLFLLNFNQLLLLPLLYSLYYHLLFKVNITNVWMLTLTIIEHSRNMQQSNNRKIVTHNRKVVIDNSSTWCGIGCKLFNLNYHNNTSYTCKQSDGLCSTGMTPWLDGFSYARQRWCSSLTTWNNCIWYRR